MHSAAPKLAELDSSQVSVTRSSSLRDVPSPGSAEELSQSYCTDHMVTVRWTTSIGWETPEVKPFQNLSIPPTASVLHYATECFEGMKAYRGCDHKLRLFRPDCNGERLNSSSQRCSLPGFKSDELKKLVALLLQIDGPRWLPNGGSFLYIRPTVIGSCPNLGIQVPKEALLYIVAVVWPDPTRLKQNPQAPSRAGLRLLASSPDSIRAWPGGFGHAKLGANYGPSLQAHGRAKSLGFDQVLWLYGPKRQVTEAGATNFFIIWRNADTDQLELVTPCLDNKMILPGITRRSVLELARERLTGDIVGDLAPLQVIERTVLIDEIEKASSEGRIVESFVSGTSYFIMPVEMIRNENTDISTVCRNGEPGRYGALIKSWLESIIFGKEKHDWAYIIDECGQ